MKKKILILFLIALAIDFFSISCNCGNKLQNCKAKFTQIHFNAFFNYSDSTSHSYIDSILVAQFDSIQFINSLWGPPFGCVKNTNTGLIISNAYACKPAPDFVKVIDTVVSYNVFTIRKYNANYAAGANINVILIHKFDENINWSSQHFTTIELISEFNIRNSIEKSGGGGLGHFSKLTQKPTNSGDTVQLAVEYGLADGRFLRDTTEKFILTY